MRLAVTESLGHQLLRPHLSKSLHNQNGFPKTAIDRCAVDTCRAEFSSPDIPGISAWRERQELPRLWQLQTGA